jgi:hypothetical protein
MHINIFRFVMMCVFRQVSLFLFIQLRCALLQGLFIVWVVVVLLDRKFSQLLVAGGK